jgi:hypothetical protein
MTVHSDLQIGEFHAELELDGGEKVRVIIPEAVCVPSSASVSYLLCDVQFLMAGHKYHSDLRKPKLAFFKTGGEYTMNVIQAHKIIRLTPITAIEPSNHRNIMLHLITNKIRSPHVQQSRHIQTTEPQNTIGLRLASPISLCLP